MSDENATLDTAASTEVEQPAIEQAVDSGSVVENGTPSNEEAGSESEGSTGEATEPAKLFAGKYKSVEELEAAYNNNNAETTRMAQRLAQFERPAQPAKTTVEAPKYTTDQLETWKEGRILEVSQAQSAAARAYAEGKVQEGQQLDAAAKEAARQIRLIDSELRKMDINNTLQSQGRKSAEGKLLNEAVGVLRQYSDQLVQGTELYAKASEFMDGYQAMGLDTENPLVQAQAVSMAAQILGLSSKKIEQTTRKELTKTINTALKQGVVTGAGKAGSSKSAVTDFSKMTDAEFIAYKRSRGWD